METNLIALIEEFGADDSKCRIYLEGLRWPDSVKCPKCGSAKISRMYTRDQFDCGSESCGYQFSVTAGTIFNDTHLSLWKWFLAVYLMCESKKGVSARQLGRSIKVAYKTAWYLCHRIRKAMEEVNPEPLGGKGATTEFDETYAGGKRRHVGSGYVGNKTMILGALERGEISQIRLRVEKNKKRGDKQVLHGFVAEASKPDTSKVYTDDNPGYLGIANEDTQHESVNHSAEEWVRGDVHTNGMEGAWSLFKRSIVGSYHQVSAKHLDRYLDEFEWRFNQRANPFLFRDTLTRLVTTEKMEYKELIDKRLSA
jgi:transposase-like protein